MIRTLGLALALSFAFLAGPSGAQERIGAAYAVEGSVTGQQQAASSLRPLSAGSDVHFKERIRARSASKGQFRFVDGSRFVVGAGGDVVLDSFIFKGAATRARLHVTKGALRFLGAGTRPGQDRVSITTPVAIVGVRGTVVDVTHARGRTAFLLLHGSAEVCRRGGACRLVTEPCTGVVVEVGVSDVLRRNASELAADFPLLGQQNRLWPPYRAATTCGVTAAMPAIRRSRGRSEGRGQHGTGDNDTGTTGRGQ